MIGLLKQKTPVNIIVLFVFGILLKLPMFRDGVAPLVGDYDGILYRKIIGALNAVSTSGFFYASITYLLLFTQALQLNRVINEQRMMQKATYFPAAAYLMCTSLLPDWNQFTAPLLVNTIVLILLPVLFHLHERYQVKAVIFNMGLGIGLSSFIFFPSTILLVWLIFGLLVIRPVRLNEWMIGLVGVTTPYYFYAAYLLLTNQFTWEGFLPSIELNMPNPNQSFWLAATGLLLVIPFLVGGYYVQENLRRMLIQVRKSWSLVLIFLLFALFIPFLNNHTEGFQHWIMILVPFAAFHACAYLYPPRKIFPFLIFWITIGFILAQQYWS